MKPPRKYPSAAAFRIALEDRLKRLASVEGIDLQRLRRQVAFDRLLCRLFASPDCPWLLKGGYAMELRLKAARTTRDIDLALKHLPMPMAGWEGNESAVLEALREAGQLETEDFFTFVFGSATQDLDAAPYGGARFPVDARLAGRSFVKYHLDVSTGDVLSAPYDALNYGHVIVDECHHLSAVSFEQVLRQVKARCLTGLTATPQRKDGHHPIIIMQCGRFGTG